MGTLLSQSSKLLSSAKHLLGMFGDYLVSQAESSSDAYARHQLRLACVEAAKTIILEEAKSITGIRDALRKRYIEAPPEQRPLLYRDMEFTEAELRRLAVYARAADYLPEFAERNFLISCHQQRTESAPEADFQQEQETSEHWIDRFNEIARIRLEPWRQDLIARALAAEATRPGMVSLRALWAIGMLDYTKFQAFSVLLDLSSKIAGGYVIPGSHHNLVIPECEMGTDIRVGELIFELNDTEILGYRDSHRHFKKGQTITASYRSERFLVRSDKVDWTLYGVAPSVTGDIISQFYDEREHQLGRRLYDSWLQGLRHQQFHIEPVQVEQSG